MEKGIIIFADGFEDVEGIATYDILKRGGIDIKTVSLNENKNVITSHGIKLFCDLNINDPDLNNFEFLILPGGLKGVNNLSNSPEVINLIKYFYNNKKRIAAICAAPSILGKLGLLDNQKFTCYPGFEKGINGHYTNEGVTVAENGIITGKAMGYSNQFGLTLLEKFKDQLESNRVKGNILP